jgi:hypothetical protein
MRTTVVICETMKKLTMLMICFLQAPVIVAFEAVGLVVAPHCG